MTDKEGGDEGAKQQGENLAQDEGKGIDEGKPRMGMYERHHERYDKSCHKVDENGVSGQVGSVAAEFLGDDSPGSCRWANQANHGSLHEGMPCHVAEYQ